MLNGVKRKGRGAEKETEKNYEAHSVCTEAFPGVSAHQSNLITISERLRAEQIRQRVCLGSRSSFSHRPLCIFFSYVISSLARGTFRAHGQAPVVLSME